MSTYVLSYKKWTLKLHFGLEASIEMIFKFSRGFSHFKWIYNGLSFNFLQKCDFNFFSEFNVTKITNVISVSKKPGKNPD